MISKRDIYSDILNDAHPALRKFIGESLYSIVATTRKLIKIIYIIV